MARRLAEALTVEVRLLAEPCLWCWEIRDKADRTLVESGWAARWTAHASRDEALAAGRERLAELRAGAVAGGIPRGGRPGHRFPGRLPRAS